MLMIKQFILKLFVVFTLAGLAFQPAIVSAASHGAKADTTKTDDGGTKGTEGAEGDEEPECD